MRFSSEVASLSCNRFAHATLICLVSVIMTACSGGSSGDESGVLDGNGPVGENTGNTTGGNVGVEECSVADINLWIDERMRDDYIYYDSVPDLNLQDYTDPVALVRDLRVSPDTYSSVVDTQENEQLISNSSVPLRFGFWAQDASDGQRHFADISGNSPMDNAGISRGDALIAINGVNYEEITGDQWQEFIVGEPDEQLTAVFTVATGDAASRDVTVTKASYIEKTVPVFGTFDRANRKIGYIKLDAFRGTSGDELDEAIELMVDRSVTELILDLRYNGGGFTRVARRLASQIAGQTFVGEVYSRRKFNDKYSQFNTDQTIEAQALDLSLSRLVVLTTADTASASETLINGLAPFIETVVIGAPTEGKPFTSVGQDYCGKRLNAMSTITTNGVGVSVIGGITPTCAVTDDYLAPADSMDDALTGAAFDYIQNGFCPLVQATLATDQKHDAALELY